MKILLADDERELAKALCAILKFNKYEVDCVYDGESAYNAALENDYDALIFDVMMPNMSGVEAVEALRKKNVHTPAILLTAKSEFADRIAGLDAGADDYLTKPFNTGELLARVRALLRRGAESKNEIISCANVTLNKETLELKSGSSSLRLSNKEFKVFELLASRIGTPVTEQQFIDRIFEDDEESSDGAVFLYIAYLRTKLNAIGALLKIDSDGEDKYILHTI